jgi:YVTN family beta-propeller protein
MSHDQAIPDPATSTSAARGPAGRSRRPLIRAAWVSGVTLVALAVPVTAFALSGSFSTPPTARNTPEHSDNYQVGRHSVIRLGKEAPAAQPASTTPAASDYYGYVALASNGEIAKIDVSTDTILSLIPGIDTTEGVAVTPDGSQVFGAETGQYDVVAYNTATATSTTIEVGAYPQDVAMSPDGSTVYATVTGGDTGAGGSDAVAVISTATDAVTGDIQVGPAPRQVVFSADGTHAYVTTESGITVINTATSTVVRRIRGVTDPQGIAVSPDGRSLYVTSPATNTLAVINAATGRVIGRVRVGAEPYAVALSPDGSHAYVTDMTADAVSVVGTATGRVIATIAVGRLPGSVAVAPDDSQVWVGNILDGNLTVINPATNTVAGTISGGTGTATLDGQPLGITFVPAS